MAPSLAQHVGCILIDIRPGIGLWSSKLHELLKPRCHLLMEPEQDFSLPYLQPLLDKPDSKFILKDWQSKDSWHPQRYVAEGLIPSADSIKNEKTSPILIVANMVSHGQRTGLLSESITKAFDSHIKSIDLIHSVREQDGFHAYGPTRVLMWMDNFEKRGLVPRTVCYRGKLAIGLESTFHVEEVASAPHNVGKSLREDAIEANSRSIVAQRMKDDNFHTPPRRQQTESDSNLVSPKTRGWHAEYEKLKDGFEKQKISQFVGKPPGPMVPARPGVQDFPYTREFKKLLAFQSKFKFENKRHDRLDALLQQQEEIDRLDLDAQRMEKNSEKQRKAIESLESKTSAYHDRIKTLSSKDIERLYFLDDDRRAFSQQNQCLTWDHRRAEPLVVEPDEFYPPSELALLDFQPLPTDQRLPMTSEQAMYFDAITTHLLGHRGPTTLEYLDTMAPGAYAALVPKAPAITDARKGGRRDSQSVRVRTLTTEMLWQLAMAWDKWLFKPGMGELLRRQSGDPDQVNMKLRLRRGNAGRT